MRALADVEQSGIKEWAQAQGYERYLASSIKGEAAVDWSDKGACQSLQAGIVADADRLLELARLAQEELAQDSIERQRIVAGAEMLGRLLLQDIERNSDDYADGDGSDGVSLKGGVSKGRMVSVHDPEMRHGHKSSRRRFDGHKAAIGRGHRHPADHRRGHIAGQRSRQPGGWSWWRRARPAPVCRCRRPWVMPPMATARPARPSARVVQQP